MYYEEVFSKLNEEGVRYLVVGGMAVVLHGVVRLTADLDLMIDLSRKNTMKFVSAMGSLGYRPRLPVPAEDFADEKKRKRWIREKNMKVFSFFDSRNSIHLVDVFVECPIDFEKAYSRKEIIKAAELEIPVVSLDDLVELKKISGREQDLADIDSLKDET